MKKIAVLLLVNSLICMSLFSLEAKAKNKESVYFSANEKQFLEYIRTHEDIDIQSNDVEIVYDREGLIQVIIKSNDDLSVTIYSPASEADALSYKSTSDLEYDTPKSVWPTIKTIWAILTFIDKTIVGCQLIDKYGDYDFCGEVWNQIKGSIVPKAKYRLTRKLYKNPSCQPKHSNMCDSIPNIYWKSHLVRVY